MYQIEEDLTEQYILTYVSQEEIFEYFLNVDVQLREFFCSPLRRDEHPTCNFNWYDGKLWFRDWAEPKPKDCFQIVKEVRNCGFFEALQIIKRELIIGEQKFEPREKSEKELKSSKNNKSTINIQFSRWQPKVINYLKQYELTQEICKKFNVFPIKKVWLNGRVVWNYSNKDPAIGYFFGKADNGEQRWKIYFFKREEKRFMCNTNRINGWIQLPEEGANLIITKSLKDVMCLYKLGYHSIAMQNETTEPYDYIIKELKERFDLLWSFYDFDPPGVRLANKLNHKYNIPYIFLTNGEYNTTDYGSKDISDYIKNNNLKKAEEFLQQCIPPF